jgi:hypothetical protein
VTRGRVEEVPRVTAHPRRGPVPVGPHPESAGRQMACLVAGNSGPPTRRSDPCLGLQGWQLQPSKLPAELDAGQRPSEEGWPKGSDPTGRRGARVATTEGRDTVSPLLNTVSDPVKRTVDIVIARQDTPISHSKRRREPSMSEIETGRPWEELSSATVEVSAPCTVLRRSQRAFTLSRDRLSTIEWEQGSLEVCRHTRPRPGPH